ncbi:MAG: hypothetical protein K9M95_01430 [Candidatus Cloacimonetes bacterium]|nr:hypothetical protein [Candidatus Cloacimonadota bacterium]MCF7882764.1 hypothetical protein [Candidatus Cloacimonadota bacterium]
MCQLDKIAKIKNSQQNFIIGGGFKIAESFLGYESLFIFTGINPVAHFVFKDLPNNIAFSVPNGRTNLNIIVIELVYEIKAVYFSY